MMNRATLCVAVLGLTIIMGGCNFTQDQTIERVVSNDGQFWASVGVNRGSALYHDWYGVALGNIRPTWADTALRRTTKGVCSLQGPGKIELSWTGPRELTVTCNQCKQEDLYIYEHEWKGVAIKYRQILGPELTVPQGQAQWNGEGWSYNPPTSRRKA